MLLAAAGLRGAKHTESQNPDLSQIPQSQFRSLVVVCRPLFLSKPHQSYHSPKFLKTERVGSQSRQRPNAALTRSRAPGQLPSPVAAATIAITPSALAAALTTASVRVRVGVLGAEDDAVAPRESIHHIFTSRGSGLEAAVTLHHPAHGGRGWPH